MYQEQRLIFYYAVSPIHMGAGTATGAIDNPIQREVHTGHPMLAGSGIKGAIRHHCFSLWKDTDKTSDIVPIFGPETSASDHAGAIAFTDAQLVAFPVRSLKETFVYATCPSALARLKRMTGGNETLNASVEQGKFLGCQDRLCVDGKLVLEAFEFTSAGDSLKTGSWLAEHALPAGTEHNYFREKLKTDLVVLNDTDFGHFVRNSTVVEPHVRIDDRTGTASDGGLFYTENLPPESILAGKVLATVERREKNSERQSPLLSAEVILKKLLDGDCGVNGKQIQVGGDATTGRGLLLINAEGN